MSLMQIIYKWMFRLRQPVFMGVALLFMATSAQAQWYKRLGATLEHDLPSTLRGMTPAQATLSHSLERAAHQASLKAARNTVATHPLKNAIFTIQEKDWPLRFASIEGTAFAIEETYQGKRYVWGVTASHYAYQKPAVKHPAHFRAVRVPFLVQGSAGMNDVSLFPLPEQFAAEITPLKLAQTDVQLGEEVSSIAYWDHRFHVDPVRKIKEISPAQMITSLNIEPNTVREGTCGGPVLNEEGEVIGMHAGNSPRQRIGYVIPVSHIRQALQAYHEGSFEQTLLFNGVNLGTIAINEALSLVRVYEGDKQIHWIGLDRRKKQIDYAHLEKLISLKESATRIVFVIKRTPLSTEQEDQQMHMYLISYDLQTGQVLRSDLNHHPIP